MSKLAPLLFVVAAVIVAVVFLHPGDGDDDTALDIGADDWDEAGPAPELRTSDGVGGVSPRKRSQPEPSAEPEQGPPRGRAKWISGIVLDDATGKPIPGATLRAEHAGQPCPRLPAAVLEAAGIIWNLTMRPQTPAGRVPMAGSATTGEDGRFTWWVGDVRTLSERYDVSAEAPGYVAAMACSPGVGDDVTIRLKKAIALEVEVSDAFGRPVEGARIMVRPGPETLPLPGTGGAGVSDEHGKGRVEGLLPGVIDPRTQRPVQVVLHVDHPDWMPHASEPFDPKQQPPILVKLRPALRLTLRIRSDDGTGIENPLLGWETDGRPPAKDLRLVQVVERTGPESEPTAELVSAPVRIPCEHRSVALEVKADGFSAWRQKEPLPADGEDREIIVVLTRNTALGSLRLDYETDEGEAVPYTELGSRLPEITNLDGIEVGSLTIEQGASLHFQSLPAGRYLLVKRSPAYAPAAVEVDVRPGEETKATVKLRPAAKLRVRFVSSTRQLVTFRLLQAGRLLPAFPVGQGAADADGGTLSAAGDEGALFSGLPAGTITVEVTSTDLVAQPVTVALKEGETSEVEIEVRER